MEDRTLVISRLLALVTYIEAHPGVAESDLARHFGRTKAQIVRDIDLLDRAGYGELYPDQTFELDYDLYASEKRLKIVRNLDLKATPKLTSNETALLTTGIDLIAGNFSDDEAELAPKIVAKVLALGTKDISTNRPIVNQQVSQTDQYRAIMQALRNGRKAKIRYRSAQEESVRVIDPFRLVQLDDGWLLEAWCNSAQARRSFRLDRILEWETLDDKRTKKPTVVEMKGENCTVYLRPQAIWRISDWKHIERHSDGRIAVHFIVADAQWMIARLIQMGTDVEATEPPRWLNQARQLARQALGVWQYPEQKELN